MKQFGKRNGGGNERKICIDKFSSGHRRQIEQLQAQIEELEARYKSDLSRLKNKYQAEIEELHVRFETIKRVKADLENQLKKLQANLKDLQDQFIEEQTLHEATRELLAAADKRNGNHSPFIFTPFDISMLSFRYPPW